MQRTAGVPEAQVAHVLGYVRELKRVMAQNNEPVTPELLGSLVLACVVDLHMTELRHELEVASGRVAES